MFLSPKQRSTAHRGAEGTALARPGRLERKGCDCKDKVFKYKMQLHLLSAGRKLKQLLW